jgi:uncharacterized protein
VKVFATKLFNYWHIGKKDQNNGVLILISKADRRVEIETGYGIEAILPDAKIGNIIDTQIIPKFKNSSFNDGTIAGTRAIISTLEPTLGQSIPPVNGAVVSTPPGSQVQATSPATGQHSTNESNMLVVWWFLGLISFGLMFIWFGGTPSSGRRSRRSGSNGSGSGGFYSGGEGGGSGGGGFGGGDSGGGGGGGSW